jgi:hypothetical protein
VGYGAELRNSNHSPVVLFLSLTNALNTSGYPIYVSVGPVAYLGNNVGAGIFANLGFDNIFNMPGLNLEVGVEVVSDHSGVNIEFSHPIN